MTCDFPGCDAEPTHDRSVWVTKGHLKVEYYCVAHAPPDAEPIDADDGD